MCVYVCTQTPKNTNDEPRLKSKQRSSDNLTAIVQASTPSGIVNSVKVNHVDCTVHDAHTIDIL